MSYNLNNYINIPWCDQDPSFRGCRCWGLVQLYYDNELNIELPDLDEIRSNLHRWRNVPLDRLEVNDVLLFRIKKDERHVGIVIGTDIMLHVEIGSRSRLENFRSLKWKNRLIKAYRYVPQ